MNICCVKREFLDFLMKTWHRNMAQKHGTDDFNNFTDFLVQQLGRGHK